ncbi:hypothetical protein PT974_08837 [Cladobotryum mycophilum]|uniref:Beta-xylosidase C-terminal Concanavalin A-like domain-containing protein n=1 Tax=Cladobotryum mycophilum TaxID=491253 RepID=A0ABR0SEH3_9HYPO
MATGQVDATAATPYPPPTTTPAVWQWRNNLISKPFSPVGRQVTVQTPPDTDIWRPARDKHNFTAPFLYTTLPTQKFKSVQVTVSAPWKTLYDQGGLVLSFPSLKNENETRFIKAGIEFTDGAPALGVVGTDILSDWSLSPLLEKQTGNAKATILIERDGTDAWVYVLEGPQKKRRSLRQVTWAFNKDDVQGVAPEIEVGIYGAKPTREPGAGHEKDGIVVSFTGFELNTTDGPVQ